MWKMSCPSSIQRRDSNPWPLERESTLITTRPGLPVELLWEETRVQEVVGAKLCTGGWMDIFTSICCKHCIVGLKKTKNKLKRGRGWPIFKKVWLCWEYQQLYFEGAIPNLFYIWQYKKIANSWIRTQIYLNTQAPAIGHHSTKF